ncbi:hypothetical protein GIB67_001634 [Kingdonia uniflora]|uniref:Fe2OG dioxygenase domain-containing protein n=1 Tax=Kingdonia uniflora TaxID=39325 RepID=A0A7J7L0S8_9MAGN|nr:hypothetical protein GIB67_001634 [Kingdonia uniflora]
MDGRTPVSAVRRVQELAVNGFDPPAAYIVKDGGTGPVADTLLSVPVIDLSILTSSSTCSKEKKEEVEKLRSALVSWGLFQVVGHGIPTKLLDDVREVGKEFFDLSMEEKKRVSGVSEDGTVDDLEGYGADNIFTIDHVLDWADRLYLLVKPQDQRKLKYWPQKPNNFRELLHEYSTKSSMVAEIIVKKIAELLGLEENHFISLYGDQAIEYARFNYYPPCSQPDLVYGIKAHTDGGGITMLLQDKEVEGLQVLKDGQWIKVPILPHALVVNIADQMEIMSNGIFKSPMHRAVTNSEKERMSLVIFYSLHYNDEIEPAAALINETTPRLFRKVTVRDYLSVFYPNYLKGERAIGWAKV